MFAQGAMFMQLVTKYGKVTNDTLSTDIVTDVAKFFGHSIDVDVAGKVVELIRADDETHLMDWCMQPENVDRLKTMIGPKLEQCVLIECPTCNELSTYYQDEIPNSNPKVVCKNCSCAIDLQPAA